MNDIPYLINHELRRRYPDVVFEGGSCVAESAIIMPETIIGNDCTIHPDVIICWGCVIEDFVEIRRYSIIYPKSKIEESSMVQGYCRVGPGSVVRTDTTIVEGTNFPSESITEARSVISMNFFPKNSPNPKTL